jgi:hypothetical protein
MKARVLAAVVLLALACREEPPPSPTVLEVRRAIDEMNAAWIRANRTADPALMEGHVAGELKESSRRTYASMRAAKRVADSRLLEVEWGDATIRGESATIELTERWEHTFFVIGTGRCFGKVPARTIRKTYTLERLDGRWIPVRSVDDPDNPKMELVPCS